MMVPKLGHVAQCNIFRQAQYLWAILPGHSFFNCDSNLLLI